MLEEDVFNFRRRLSVDVLKEGVCKVLCELGRGRCWTKMFISTTCRFVFTVLQYASLQKHCDLSL